MMTTCSKVYADFPFSHRQPWHDGHCRFVHGHNWSFEFEFGAERPDQCGFIVDFGKLKEFKAWLDEWFDHTLVICADDPLRAHFESHRITSKEDAVGIYDLRIIPDCSCEGIARWLLDKAAAFIGKITDGRATVVKVVVREDSKNSATARA